MKIKDVWPKDPLLEMENLLTEAEDAATEQWDVDFVASIRASFKKFGVHTWLSPKQHDKLLKITGAGGTDKHGFDKY